jgi:hypothetical protein
MERVLAAAKEGFEDGLSGLERLKRNLQNAAVLCQPAGAAGAVFETELEARCRSLSEVCAGCARVRAEGGGSTSARGTLLRTALLFACCSGCGRTRTMGPRVPSWAPADATFALCPYASFDSADLDEEDPDEGVGVDERAALLQPEDFFLDDEDWYASARWLMERPQTEDFITAALLTHMAPLYVPFADIRARTPKEVVPADVQVVT